jgi:plasmid replication initiation protein
MTGLAPATPSTPAIYELSIERYRGIRVEVHGFPEHGMATIWDADVLIWAVSQIVEAADHGLKTSRFFRFRPYQLLIAIGRGPAKANTCD